VDADFAGLWNAKQPNVVGNLRSRTGYLLTLGDTPVVWASKLQSVIALSTMESEFISLSAALKALILLRDTHFRISQALSLLYETKSHIFEDNQACITLATTDPPRMTPRSKHIAICYFWFREHLRKCKDMKIIYIPTNAQRANHLTKPLPYQAPSYCNFSQRTSHSTWLVIVQDHLWGKCQGTTFRWLSSTANLSVQSLSLHYDWNSSM
jgi:hypothetical protein